MGLPPTKEKNPKPQNVGSTPLSFVNFQCEIASYKEKKILSLKIWDLQKGSEILISLPCSRVLHQDLQEEENREMNPILDL